MWIAVARTDSSQPLSLEIRVKYILDGLEIVSNMLNRQTYQLITFENIARTQGVHTWFTIDELVTEARRVS